LAAFWDSRTHGLFSNFKKAGKKYTSYSQKIIIAKKRTPGVLKIKNSCKKEHRQPIARLAVCLFECVMNSLSIRGSS